MTPFWHFDAGNLSVLIVAAATYYKVSIMHYQHKLMWRDYEKRHGMNGKKLAEAHD
jgi:hypothetical protein